jgi:hypothetical protein
VIRLAITTPGGEILEAVAHEPPEWLWVAAPVECDLERIVSEDGDIDLITNIRHSKALPEATPEHVTIERIDKASNGLMVVEGRKEGGGIFSYLIQPSRLHVGREEPPLKAVVFKTRQRGSEGIVAVVSQRSFRILKRTIDLLRLLKEQERIHPELEFLRND